MTTLENPTKDIAQRLAGLRDAVGLSPEELAGSAGVDPADVLQFESGETEIPVSYLYKVAKICRVDLTELLTGGQAHLHSWSVVRKDEGLRVQRRKEYSYHSLAYRFVNRQMEPFLVTVGPKDEADLSFNTHSGHEFIYVLEGRLEVFLGGDKVVLEPHDSLYLDSRTPHAMRSLDAGPAQFLDVII